MPDLKRDDISYHYEIGGEGPPLLLHAGMLSDSATWAPLLPLLEEQFTVIRPDNRTTGRTTPVDAPNGAAEMAGDVLALMDHLGHDRFHVAGHSLGGLMSLELAHRAPGRIATASIFASGRVRMPRTVAIFDTLMAIRRAPEGEALWLRALYPWVFGQAFFADPANVDTALEAALAYPYGQSAEGMAHQIEMLRSIDLQADPAQITCPVMVLYAGDDLLVQPKHARNGFAPIPNLTEHTIEAAGHSIIWDAPEDVATHLLAFLNKNAIG